MALATAAPCLAQTAYYGGSPDRLSLTVDVRASVAARCGFAPASAPGASYVEPDFETQGFDRVAAFKLDCTSASRVGVVSSNGGLATGAAAGPGYAALAPYDVQLTLNGNALSATATCGAKDLIASSNACAPTYLPAVGPNFTGPASASKGLRLPGPATIGSDSTIRLKAGAYAGASILTAGTYVDTLTVTISPAT
ncbi:hypothetical protein [Sphingomonas antarctica]|uniref:hypothetical protein n=1 Tax=Sphingomonas antarctica TaxID=2040274 RepID=UPI0039EA6B03